MDGRARLTKAVREVGIGFVSAIGVLLLFARGSAAAVEVAYLGLALATWWWTASVPAQRLRSRGGRLRPFVLTGLVGLIGVATLSLTVVPEPLVVLAVFGLIAALVTAVRRALRAVAPD